MNIKRFAEALSDFRYLLKDEFVEKALELYDEFKNSHYLRERDEFQIGDYVYATWDDEPQEIIKKDSESYMIYRGPNKDVPQWLSFDDAMSEEEAIKKFPDDNPYIL